MLKSWNLCSVTFFHPACINPFVWCVCMSASAASKTLTIFASPSGIFSFQLPQGFQSEAMGAPASPVPPERRPRSFEELFELQRQVAKKRRQYPRKCVEALLEWMMEDGKAVVSAGRELFDTNVPSDAAELSAKRQKLFDSKDLLWRANDHRRGGRRRGIAATRSRRLSRHRRHSRRRRRRSRRRWPHRGGWQLRGSHIVAH